MPDLSEDEYQRLVDIVALGAGADRARGRYLVDTASRVYDRMIGKDRREAVQLLALCLNTFGAMPVSMRPAIASVPALPSPDPARLQAVQDHISGSETTE